MRRLSLVLVILFALACAGFAQKSGSSSTGSSSTGSMSTGTVSSGGSVSGTATTSPTSTGQQTPLAPAIPTTVNPGNPNAPAGGSPLVPGSAVPTATSNQQFNTFTGTGGVGATGGVGQVAPSFHLETELPAPGVTDNGTGTPAGVTNGGSPGNSSPTSGSIAVYDVAGRGANLNNGAGGGPEIVDVAGDLAGMTFVNGNLPPEQAQDTRTLGEVAAQYKRQGSVQAAHVYTNDDIARLNARNDVSVMGPNQNVALPQGEGAPAPQQPAKKNQKRTPFTPQQPK